MRAAWAAALVLTLAAPATAAPSAQPAGMVATQGLQRISPHVQVIPDNSVMLVPNVGFVVGTRGVLVIDTGLGPKNGAAVATVAARLAPGRQVWLVTTHAHPEHDLGASGFPAAAKVIRSREEQADIADQGLRLARVFAGFSPAIAELLAGAQYRPTDVSFDREYRLDLGGVTARLMAMGPNHTAGDTAVWVESDGVLFTGDLAMKAQPALTTPKASLAHWLETLGRLAALKPKVVVPSHGPLGDAEYIEGYRAYFVEVRERMARAKAAGKDPAAAQAEVAAAMADRYPMRDRLASAARLSLAQDK